ncbi:MAG: hypothetical protein ACE5H3_02125, partial [Planctomycetota bacterium]
MKRLGILFFLLLISAALLLLPQREGGGEDPVSWDLPRLEKEVQRARALRVNRVEDRAVADQDGKLALRLRTGADFWIALQAPGRARTALWMQRMDGGSRIDRGA